MFFEQNKRKPMRRKSTQSQFQQSLQRYARYWHFYKFYRERLKCPRVSTFLVFLHLSQKKLTVPERLKITKLKIGNGAIQGQQKLLRLHSMRGFMLKECNKNAD